MKSYESSNTEKQREAVWLNRGFLVQFASSESTSTYKRHDPQNKDMFMWQIMYHPNDLCTGADTFNASSIPNPDHDQGPEHHKKY